MMNSNLLDKYGKIHIPDSGIDAQTEREFTGSGGIEITVVWLELRV